MKLKIQILTLASVLLLSLNASAQHLWWNLAGQGDGTCLYGEITVLATQPTTYYCGANWHPGEPAGGYCGIQHNDDTERRTIFSIWDTSPTLHPSVSEADTNTITGRFGGEGEGGHTHRLWDWKTNETFQFFVRKQPGLAPDTTDAEYFIFDRAAKKWQFVATITSPNGGQAEVGTLGGGVNSFLENFSGENRSAARLAVYRLWLGTNVDNLKCLTQAVGDGQWGELHDNYFLANGGTNELGAVFSNLESQYGKPVFGGKGIHLDPLNDRALSPELITQLKALPRAASLSATGETCAQASPEEMAAAVGVTLPKRPWHVINIWWDFQNKIPHFTSLEMTVTIDRDIPSTYNLYVSPCGIANINGMTFYGGLQSNINGWLDATNHERVFPGHGAIFSRWSSDKKTPVGLENVRIAGDDCVVESAGYEGEFASVRRPFAWTKGTYTYCINKGATEITDGKTNTWFTCTVKSADGSAREVGSLRFEGSDFTFWARHSAFVEVYSTAKVSESDIPKVNITFGWPRINGEKVPLKKVTARYPYKPGEPVAPDCAWVKADGENCRVEVGPIFVRDEKLRQHELKLQPAATPAAAAIIAAGGGEAAAQAATNWPAADPAAIAHWRDLRFGMFIHWGPVSLTGKEIGWSRGAATPIAVYDNLYKEFNPTNFNADEWVSIAKAAGMKYIVLTTKHHDGFCLWDTKLTDYNIMHTPFHRDVVKELAAACKKQGIAFGAYYSVTDWYDQDWPVTSPAGHVKRDKSDLDAYEKYLQGQIAELINNYGPLITIWNDVPAMYKQRGAATIKLVRSLQPDILINNRTGDGGDYDTPEQKVGAFQMNRPWESCMTVSAHNHWAWGNEQDGVKPVNACLKMIVLCAGGDGNCLLNVGPRPDGIIDPAQAGLLKKVGAWIGKNGESIYGTRGGPFMPGKYGVSTRSGKTIYVHILKWPTDGAVELPAIAAKIVSAEILGGGKADVQQANTGIKISVTPEVRDAFDTIVALKLETDAVAIPAVAVDLAPTAK